MQVESTVRVSRRRSVVRGKCQQRGTPCIQNEPVKGIQLPESPTPGSDTREAREPPAARSWRFHQTGNRCATGYAFNPTFFD